MKSAQNLVWLDLEMTGLNPEEDVILEIATIVTNSNLEIVAKGPVIAIKQPQHAIDNMNDWCQKTHNATGLIKRVQESLITENQAEQQTLLFLQQHLNEGVSPLCGNSIGQDRRFLAKYMPTLNNYFHYRNIDVSTLKELALRWKPELLANITKQSSHKAFDDICESIEELRYYKAHFIKI